MKGKLLAFGVALLAVATIGVVQLQSKAVDSSRDCDNFAVIRCGALTASELKAEYDTNNGSGSNGTTVKQDDIQKVFTGMGISQAELNLTSKAGIVYKDGTVKVNGNVVATGAMMAARGLGGTPITGTSASKISVSAMSDAQTALVFYKDGKFAFAVMKPCGNPVTATPPPQPQPLPKAECTSLTVDKIERTKFRFNAKADVSGGATVKGFTFVVSKNGNTVDTISKPSTESTREVTYSQEKAGNYSVKVTVSTSEGDKSGPDCTQPFTVKEQPAAKIAECTSLTVTPIQAANPTSFKLDAVANAENGATIQSYTFEVLKAGQVIATQPVTSTQETATFTYNQTAAGDYVARVTVNSSEGAKTGPKCEKPFTVTPPTAPTPGVDIFKYFDGNRANKYKRVNTSVEFTYSIDVANTGNVDLTNVLVTDTPDRGVTLVSVMPNTGKIENNTWTYTIPKLMKSETQTFTLTAKVPVYLAGKLTNTVCVDAREVPGNPDKCDKAEVDVPTQGKVRVCNPANKQIIEVDEDQASKYAPVDSAECKTVTLTVAPPTAEALPETGPSDVALQVVGAMSLVGSAAYFVASRKNA